MMMSLLDGSGMTGDIWSTGAFAVDSPLKDLLDSGDFTIEQLLAEDELLQELRGLHPQLLDYFSTEEAVSALVRYLIIDTSVPVPERPESTDAADDKKDEASGEDETTRPPEPGKWLFQHLEEIRSNADKNPEAVPENLYIRFPYMACEIICCELKGIIDVLVDGYVPPETQKTSAPGGTQQQPDAEEESKTQHPETEEGVEKQGGQRILDLLFSVLYDTAPGDLDDYRAGYLEKILSVLFRKRPQALSDYLDNGGGKEKVTLMKAMFKHLYSHSIMQLVQRLLLPQPPHLQQKAENDENQQGNKEGDDEEDDGNLVLEAAPGSLIVEDADDETKTFHCSWSESEEALDLLLQPLIYPDSSLSPEMELMNGQKAALSVEDGERRLNLCQNASEVLITIIQNSPLNSNTMLRLTVDPILGKLVDRASALKDGEEFCPHESNLTAAMNVLESLILQLGGYGSVGTISLLPTEEGVEDTDIEKAPPPRFADLQTLLTHIPRMLDSVSKLLLHPACDDWRSPMQYSKPSEPQLLLGMSRLRIVRLLESLVLLGESNVDTLLCRSDCLQICLDLFWKFQWCSMLHQSVANLLVHVFEGANARSEMQEYFLVKCNLLGRLMDSFSEVSPGEPGYVLRDSAPVSEQAAVVIGMKGLDIDREKSPSTEAQSASQEEERIPVSDDDIDSALEQAEAQRGTDEINAAAAMADLAGSNSAKQPPKKPSEASSMGQISTEAVRYESRDASTVGPMIDGAPAQSFRLGYMGHVIIICQALVHACSADEANDEMQGQSTDSTAQNEADEAEQRQSLLSLSDTEESKKMNGERHPPAGEGEEDAQLPPQHPLIAENEGEEVLAGRDDGESARGVDSNAEGIPPPNPLILSKIIDSHPLSSRWQEFVRTTLASETAIQSTPLGGFNNNVGGDPLHAHRPLGDDEFDDDGSGQATMPPRGMLGGGDVIDMDDNDLDIAASMMAGLRLARDGDDDDDNNDNGNDSSDDEESDGSGNTYDSGRNSAKDGYFFDDPLGGGKKSGLGLALGNLGQYHANGSGSDEDNNSSGGSDGGDGSDQSSDGEKDEPRTMNLFAGNMERGSEDQLEASPLDDTAWSNFANFDDAFASEANKGGFPSSQSVFAPADPSFSADFGAAEIQKPSDGDPFPSPPSGPATEAIDEIFGVPKTHAILLDDYEGTRPKMKILPDEKPEDATNGTAQAVPEGDEENSETSGN